MKWKNYILQMLNQFIPVVLGVYLGIVASNLNSDRLQKAEQKKFINNLYLEIRENKNKLEKIVGYREDMVLKAKKVRQRIDKPAMEANFWSVGNWSLLPGWKGAQIPTLESSVYQSGIFINAFSGLDFNVINTIANTYNLQEDYRAVAQKLIFDNLIQMEADVKTVEVLNKIEVWGEIIENEKNLINHYEQTLGGLKELK